MDIRLYLYFFMACYTPVFSVHLHIAFLRRCKGIAGAVLRPGFIHLVAIAVQVFHNIGFGHPTVARLGLWRGSSSGSGLVSGDADGQESNEDDQCFKRGGFYGFHRFASLWFVCVGWGIN